MRKTDACNLAQRLAGLYPTASREQIELAGKRLLDYPANVGAEAVDELAQSQEFFSLPKLIGIMREKELRIQQALARHNAETVAWWLHKQGFHPQAADDTARVLAHYAHCWAEVQRVDVTEVARQFMRGMIFGHCLAALNEIGNAQARALTQEAIGMADETAEVFK